MRDDGADHVGVGDEHQLIASIMARRPLCDRSLDASHGTSLDLLERFTAWRTGVFRGDVIVPADKVLREVLPEPPHPFPDVDFCESRRFEYGSVGGGSQNVGCLSRPLDRARINNLDRAAADHGGKSPCLHLSSLGQGDGLLAHDLAGAIPLCFAMPNEQ